MFFHVCLTWYVVVALCIKNTSQKHGMWHPACQQHTEKHMKTLNFNIWCSKNQLTNVISSIQDRHKHENMITPSKTHIAPMVQGGDAPPGAAAAVTTAAAAPAGSLRLLLLPLLLLLLLRLRLLLPLLLRLLLLLLLAAATATDGCYCHCDCECYCYCHRQCSGSCSCS